MVSTEHGSDEQAKEMAQALHLVLHPGVDPSQRVTEVTQHHDYDRELAESVLEALYERGLALGDPQ